MDYRFSVRSYPLSGASSPAQKLIQQNSGDNKRQPHIRGKINRFAQDGVDNKERNKRRKATQLIY